MIASEDPVPGSGLPGKMPSKSNGRKPAVLLTPARSGSFGSCAYRGASCGKPTVSGCRGFSEPVRAGHAILAGGRRTRGSQDGPRCGSESLFRLDLVAIGGMARAKRNFKTRASGWREDPRGRPNASSATTIVRFSRLERLIVCRWQSIIREGRPLEMPRLVGELLSITGTVPFGRDLEQRAKVLRRKSVFRPWAFAVVFGSLSRGASGHGNAD
jgi:hypothetical protein